MRCSACSREVKPVVAIDIDGTLGDYHQHLIRFGDRYAGKETPNELWYDGSMAMKEWGKRVWDLDDRGWRDLKLAYRQGGSKRSMPIFDGATEMTHAVREAGAELWLTTTRPYMRLDNVDPDTREWLRRNSIEFDGLLYDEAKYPRLAELVDVDRVVAVVDDLPEMIIEARETFGPRIPIYRRTGFNRPVTTAPSLHALPNITIEILDRIEKWKEQNS